MGEFGIVASEILTGCVAFLFHLDGRQDIESHLNKMCFVSKRNCFT